MVLQSATPCFLRGALLLALAGLVAAPAAGQREPEPPWAKQWKQKRQNYAAARDAAQRAALREFDRAIAGVAKLKGLSPTARIDRRNELQDARKLFARAGEFPPEDSYAGIQLRYFLTLNRAALPVAKMVDEWLERASKAGDPVLEERWLTLKAEWERELGATSTLVQNSLWHGTLRDGSGRTIPYHLYIGKMGSGGSFRGHIEDNPGVAGNWSYDVEGQTRVFGVAYRMSRSLRGSFTAVSVDGIVSGDRLIAQITSAVGRKTATALIMLKRVR
jgi:hypothetical protein